MKKFSLPVSVLLALTTLLAACATVSPRHDQIALTSMDYRFIGEIYQHRGSHRDVDAWLVMPEADEFSPPYPAVILLHSSWGLSEQEWLYARLMADMGIAALVIDSFRPRGVRRTSADQSLVSSASMLADAFSALDYLAADARFDSDKIAIMGFSKGAIAALYSSLTRVQRVMAIDGRRFAAHLAFYPWCGLQLRDMETTGVPIAIHGGSNDVITPIDQCLNFVDEQLTDKDKSHIQVVRYENARHAFDHPALQNIPFVIPMSAQVPGDCRLVEEEDGLFKETSTDRSVNGENIGEVLAQCSRSTGVAGRNRDAAQLARENVKRFMRDILLN